jgi:DHA1 family bicyclomycin/chloramphenicol resistance-like MFS transporter
MNPKEPVPMHRGWLTTIVVAQLAFGLVAMTISLPSMQDWPATFGASQAAVQLTFSGYVFAYGVLQLVYGPLSDRLGRKPVLLFGLGLAVLASLLALFAPNLPVLVAARVLQGAGCAACMVVGRALVQDHFTGSDRTRVMALVGMTMGVCPPLATLVGGQLHVRWGWQANFALLTLLAAGMLLATWRVLPGGKPQGVAPGKGWGELFAGYAQLLREPAFLLYVVLLSTTTASFYSFLGGAPLVLGRYGVTPEKIGWYIMCIPGAYILGNWLTSRFIRRFGDRILMGVGQAATVAGISLALALGLGGWNSPLSLALPMILLGVGHGLLVPPTLTGTVGLVPALAGSASAVGGLMQQLTGATGGFLVGLMPHEGQVNLSLVMLGWTLAGLTAHVLLFRVVLRRS